MNVASSVRAAPSAVLIMTAVVIGAGANQIAWNIVGVALPRMQGAYSASPDQISWVMSAFVLGNTLMFALVGWLAERFGRRVVFLTSIALFVLTLIACALAPSLELQIFWRFVQGLASAALLPLGHAIVADAYPPEKFGQATVIWGVGLTASGAVAPLLGGVLVDRFGWPSVYWFTAPLAVVSYLTAWAYVPETRPNVARRMDWIGVAGVLMLIGATQLVLARGHRLDWFASTEIVVATALGASGLYLFVVRSLTARAPFASPAMFADRNFALGLVFGFLQGALVMLSLVILPLLLEGVMDYTVVDAGALLAPRGLGVIVGMLLIGRLADRADPRLLIALGYSGLALSNYLMSRWTLDVTANEVILANFVLGVSGGSAFAPITKLAFLTLDRRYASEGFAFFYLLFYTGVASGIAFMLTVVASSTQVSSAELGAHVTLYSKLLGSSALGGGWSRDGVAELSALAAEIARQATMIAYNNGFVLSMFLALGAAPCALLFRVRRTGAA